MVIARRPFALLNVLALLVGLVLMWPGSLYFLNDDFIHIPLSARGEWLQRNSFRPICDLSIALDYHLWGKEAWGYHLANLLLHITNTWLVYLVSRRWYAALRKNMKGFAAITAVLFFVYPFHSESVFWIIGRSASLGTMFLLPAIYFYIGSQASPKQYWLSLLFFALSLLAYETAWVFPLMALALSWAQADSSIQKRMVWWKPGVVAVLFIVFLLTRFFMIHQVIAPYEGRAFLDGDILSMAGNFAKLVARSFVPPMGDTRVVAGVSIIIPILLVVLVAGERHRSRAAILLLFFLLSLLPFLSLGIDTHGVEGERYLYLSSVFASMMLAGLVARIWKAKRRLGVLVYAGMIALSSIALYRSGSLYRDAGNIARTTVRSFDHLEHCNVLHVYNLPQENNGALMYRLGFPEAVHWMSKAPRNIQIKVHSVAADTVHFAVPYGMVVVRTFEGNDSLAINPVMQYNFKRESLWISQ